MGMLILQLAIIAIFIKSLFNIKEANLSYRIAFREIKDFIVQKQIQGDDDIKRLNSKDNKELLGKGIIFCLVCLFKFIEYIINLALMITMLKFDHTPITLILVVWALLSAVIGTIKIKTHSNNKKIGVSYCDALSQEYEKICADTFYKAFCRVGSIVYWGYAVFLILF